MKTLAHGALIALLIVGACRALAQGVEEGPPGGTPGATADRTGDQAEGCKTEVVTASGRMKYRPLTKTNELEGKGSAMADAVRSWEREVEKKFGARWKWWSKAKDTSFECTLANSRDDDDRKEPLIDSIVGCTIKGQPCAFDPSAAATNDALPGQEERSDDTPRCYGIIAAVGREQSTREKALVAAHDAWLDRVMFDFGERYTDLNYAEDRSSICAFSYQSTLLKRAYFSCKLIARPCRRPPGLPGSERYEMRLEESED
jgi:hypothetical protein